MNDAGKDAAYGGAQPAPSNHRPGMNRDEVSAAVVSSRLARGFTRQRLAYAINRPLMWTTAALLGQHPLPAHSARRVAELLNLPAEAVPVLAAVPYRSGLPTAVPAHPTIYRFHEAPQLYGPALKELIHEQFDDGIMSAINSKPDIGRATHDGAGQVVITLNGKFLPCNWPRG
ncbi:cyanase [Streptomyces sp. NPDC002403]